MNNQAGRSDEQRVKEVYADASVTPCAGVWEIWESEAAEGDYSRRLGHSAKFLHLAWADAASRLPKSEAAPPKLAKLQCAHGIKAGTLCHQCSPVEWNISQQKAAAPPAEKVAKQESPCLCMVTDGGYVYRHHVPGCPASSPVVAGGESESDETRTAIALDRQFLAGMSLGWNLGVVEDREEFNRRLDSGYKAIRDAKAELKDVRGTEDWSANDDAHMDAQDKLRGGTR